VYHSGLGRHWWLPVSDDDAFISPGPTTSIPAASVEYHEYR
jgi:hypothetical protein